MIFSICTLFYWGFQDFKQAVVTGIFKCYLWFHQIVITSKKCHPQLMKVIALMDLGWILIKTDAPLLLPLK